MPKQIIITHIMSRVDSRKKIEYLTLPERVNIRADEILFISTSIPIATNIKDTMFGIYIYKYISYLLSK